MTLSRRCLLLTAAALALPASAATPPPEVAGSLPAARLQGEGQLRYFGFLVYDGRLWTPPGFEPAQWAASPLALELRYARDIEGDKIAERSLEEMQRQGALPAGRAQPWLEDMKRLFPDVREGDRLTGVHKPGVGARFYLNGRPRGEVADAEFSQRFFGIWLAAQTAEPGLRERLLGARLMSAVVSEPWRGSVSDGLRYGALGLPLAFVALPLYVVLPNFYASEFGVPLATLGLLLLGARLFDAFTDPWIGHLTDGWFKQSVARVLMVAVVAAAVLMAGFRGLFFPPVQDGAALLWWCAGLLAITYFSFSVLSVVHQAWGARLGGGESQRARIVSWREGLALVGVLVASVLPSVAGLNVSTATFAVLVALGVAMLWRAPRPVHDSPVASTLDWRAPLASPAFRRLLLVYLVNGIASAVPATLVLFFIRDRLQVPAWEPLFLASYFAAGALSMPLWVRLVGRLGLARTWLAGMALAVASFVWAATLGAGDGVAYALVCVASGFALGADLALPGALLAGLIQREGHAGRLEGMYFGWWNFATKLNLALAAGIALPMLAWFGYAPGSTDPQALTALTLAYCLLPCVLKLIAASLLWWRWIRHPEEIAR